MEIRHVEQRLWTPVRTKPRREKKLWEYCEAKGIACYLPLKKSVKRYQRKTFEFFPPMFPGYVFCLLDEAAYRELLLSHAVLFRVAMDENSEPRLIEDLNSVQIMETLSREHEVFVKPELTPGTRAMIAEGPLKGIRGVIAKRRGGMSVTVNIEILGNSVTVEVDVGDLEKET